MPRDAVGILREQDLVHCAHARVANHDGGVMAEVSLHVQVPVHIVTALRIRFLVANRSCIVDTSKIKKRVRPGRKRTGMAGEVDRRLNSKWVSRARGAYHWKRDHIEDSEAR